MNTSDRANIVVLNVLPFVALACAGARPLHDVPGHALLGVALFVVGLAAVWRLAGPTLRTRDAPGRSLALAGVLLAAPWLLIALLWTGLGAPFQADDDENRRRYVLLMVDALLVSGGFIVLRDALAASGERFFASAGFAAALPAGGLYLASIAITLAVASMAVEGQRAGPAPLASHLYDALEFFSSLLTYLATALFATALDAAGLLRPRAARVFAAIAALAVVLLLLRGIEYPTISGQTAPWWSQPGVIVRIPAIPWLMPALLGARLLGHVARSRTSPAR